MSQLKSNLIKSCKELDFIQFKKNLIEYENKYGTPNFCLLTPVLENYKSNDDEIIFKIKTFISVIINDVFVFEDDILKKQGNEVIDLFEIYQKIGLDYSNDINGNNILHSQVKGLNYEGVKFLIDNGASPFVINNLLETPLETLFTHNYNHLNISTEEINYIKEKIAYILIDKMKKNIDLNFEKSLIFNTVKHKIYNNECFFNDISIIKKLFNINFLKLNLSLKI